ncbi:DUF1444 domain-containing protein [Actinophytocola sediminis]
MDQLTAPQQERLRRLVRRSPAFIGMRIEVQEDHVEVLHPEQLVLGFGSLSLLVADAPEGQWPEVVDQYLERILALGATEPPELSGPTEELLGRIYVRLMEHPGPTYQLPDYVEELVPGLVTQFAFDLPDAIMNLTDEHVARHGFDRLYEAGMENLCRELPERYLEGDDVYVLQGSEYVGSLVLVIPWVIEALTGLTEVPNGALVAMPARDQLIFHVIRDREQTTRAVAEIGRIAGEWYAENPFGISPRVYWWRPLPVGGLESVAHHDGDDVITYYSSEFADTLYEVDREWE